MFEYLAWVIVATAIGSFLGGVMLEIANAVVFHKVREFLAGENNV